VGENVGERKERAAESQTRSAAAKHIGNLRRAGHRRFACSEKAERRLLKPGGRFSFNAWDQIADNEFADVVTETLEFNQTQFFAVDRARSGIRFPNAA
jgi:hypothetical protein